MRREMRKIRLKLRRRADWIDGLAGQLKTMRDAAVKAGRDPDGIGVEVMAPLADASEKARERLKKLADLGVTHSAVVTMNAGLSVALLVSE